jgi:hypothetical protein
MNKLGAPESWTCPAMSCEPTSLAPLPPFTLSTRKASGAGRPSARPPGRREHSRAARETRSGPVDGRLVPCMGPPESCHSAMALGPSRRGSIPATLSRRSASSSGRSRTKTIDRSLTQRASKKRVRLTSTAHPAVLVGGYNQVYRRVDTEGVPAPCWTLPVTPAPSRARCSGPW